MLERDRLSVVCFVIGISATMLFGCGARTGLADDELGDASAGCPIPDAVRGVVGRVDGLSCVLEGQSEDGRTHSMECAVTGEEYPHEFAGCWWITDGETVCECEAPDWSNTCVNGVPICADWRGAFDFGSDVDFSR